AARAYLDAAEAEPRAIALEYRRRAAVQYLRTGRLTEGSKVLDEVLHAVGMRPPPEVPWRAAGQILWRRAVSRTRGLRYQPRDETEVSAAQLALVDASWSGQ